MKQIYKALANFQQEVPVILKDTQGYGYSYADLPTIFEVINPLLKKNGLGFYQAVNGNSIKTVIFHIDSSDTIESETDIPQGVQLKGMNDFQVIGSAITYIKRYALSSLLGLVTDKDTNASGEQLKKPEAKSPEVPKMKPEEAFENAKKALNDAETLEDLNIVNTQISKSKILTAENKQTLSFTYQEKSETFDPTK